MLGWFRALMPREDRFFDLFAQHSHIVVQAAEALQSLLAGGDVEKLAREIMALEDQADVITHQVLEAVHKSFITPFDRGDIKDLIQSLDDAIDMMRKTVKTVLLYEQKSFEPLMQEMGDSIVTAARLVDEAIPLLNRVGVHASRLQAIAEDVTRVEGRSDQLHDQGMKELFLKYGHSEPMTFMIGRELYSQLEKVVDRFEDVADEISGIVIENV
ncbi:hypothetical protein C7441_107138 [Pseudaminobacter salicylatoxidans]|uniref:Nuclease PIN n=1 Tax=Pseudaminobacter salicylatoxidans TaxID=93369 RepID=A0A316C7F0_PSESE|nr:DUF47 domain-containing protein [Pseudaminobacter salicylatoxidans]PWJ83977.1 hypothetical protein C7441_107138 [Pseudaminobacter salicylatoxidans]